MRTYVTAALLALAPALTACALGPHEILLLVNRESEASRRVAAEFAALRHVPPINVVEVSVRRGPEGFPLRIDRESFTRDIWTPATAAARERGIERHILAWVYSVDFPTAVDTRPVMSLQGVTFLRNRAPALREALSGLAGVERAAFQAEKNPARRDIASAIRKLYVSPLFSGPDSSGRARHFSQTLDVYRDWLRADMPLPSMMLGYVGKRGNDLNTVLSCLRRGAESDHTRPEGAVHFVVRADVRSKCREWQYSHAQQELLDYGIDAVITRQWPAGKQRLVGVMTGAANVDTDALNGFVSGAVADHLTSHAANFDQPNQTKISAWISAGCTASAGTVTEPISVWAKFPTARFFVHYAAGCSVLESYFQSIRCPLQILLLGDPLAKPWEPQAEVVVHGLEPTTSGSLTLRAEATSTSAHYYGRFLFLIDGRVVSSGKIHRIEAADMEEGTHTLRVVAYRTGMVRHQAFRETTFVVRNKKEIAFP